MKWKLGAIFWIMRIGLMLKGSKLQKSRKNEFTSGCLWNIRMPMEHQDAYGVKIEPGQNALIMTITTTALDQMAYED
ncbi:MULTISPECIES: hypothetical protein [Methanosarcina]|uniref:Uncharacterized protein n=3 Tax=Methanosarcina barkeri TaxID=2208 RepID=A0A0E3QV89_METBA|nr:MULTISPECIES: hypothetical protein [Methanosarcina]AKB54663.1 hypothetical protein MSBRM_1665 [Methanosarcina barkeri MS]AKB57254.1 hypothetical protein MSBR2_0738 [Methanosarcina barkeri 227]AKJ37812.1 hypothetical protein MCM1_0732 [Methanosarcina barkeri CM1]OEC90956.1 hypothetical protein A9239_03950 [Methanosarcina sp. A14]